MPFSYNPVKREAALKLAQIVGSSQSTLETAYNVTAWASCLDGAEIPRESFKTLILQVEKTFANEIGANAQHPARNYLYSRSEALSDLDSTPAYDINGVEWVGIWDSASDAVDNTPCTWMPTQTISDCLNSFFDDTALYYYNITGNFIRTTRDSIFLQGCVWSYDQQSDAYDADQNTPLPEYLEAGMVAGVIAMAPQVGWTDASNVTQQNMQLYQEALASCRSEGNVPLASREKIAG